MNEIDTFADYLMKGLLYIITVTVVCVVMMIGCRKDDLIKDHDAKLYFSTDTVYFDTVLSSLGSITRHFKIYNRHDQPIEIAELFLGRRENSYYRLNVDGTQGKEFRDIRIEPGDSIFVFVAATIDPQDESNPVIIKDSVVCMTNDNLQNIKLIAYGQDVKIFRREIFKTQSWTSEKPYLIEGYAIIDSNEVLTIDPGTRIYLTHNSSLGVWGKIIANGTYDAPVLFTGSRFDGSYEDISGQWGTISIHQKSTGNRLEHVIIKNAQRGLQLGYPTDNSYPELELRNCMILNSGEFGILAFSANINAYNTIIADCAYPALIIEMGGTYNFYHCTISNVSAYYPESFDIYKPRSEALPSVFFTNYVDWIDLDNDYRIEEVTYPKDIRLHFYNSIIYGNQNNEIYYDTIPLAGMDYRFDHCLLKIANDSMHLFDTISRFISVIRNEDPGFINDSIYLGDYDFRLDTSSAAINKGSIGIVNSIPGLEYDAEGNLRTADGYPDLGAYERVE